jgi:hypothetical protein
MNMIYGKGLRVFLAVCLMVTLGYPTFYNTTFQNRINVNATTSYMTDNGVQTLIIMNASNWGDVSLCKDTIYCNDSAVTWYNTTSSAEQYVPFYWERYNVTNATSNSYLWVLLPQVAPAEIEQVWLYFNSSTVTRPSAYNGSNVFLKFYDFENSTTVPADFGYLNPATMTIETDGGYEMANYLKSTDDTVWGFSATRKNATMVAYIKAVGGDWGTYMGTNTDGTWAGSTANQYPIPQVTTWSRYVIDWSGSSVNYTIAGTTYTKAGLADMGQTVWGYNIGAFDSYTDVLMLAKYMPLWTMDYAFSSVEGQSASAGSNTVTLNYPNNGVTNTTNQIQFGYTPNFTIGNIQNCSLYTNESGWGISEKNGTNPAYCYQESANVSTACGGLATGNYTIINGTSSWSSPENMTDGDWNTFAHALGDTNFFINYTIPSGIKSAIWQEKDKNGLFNLTIPQVCLNQTVYPNLLAFWINTASYTRMICYSGGAWGDIDTWTNVTNVRHEEGDFYEEAMWWNMGVVNNSLNTITHQFNNSGTYLWNIACWNESNEIFSASNRTLTLTEYTIGNPATGYESMKYPFNISFSFSGYTYANVGIVYNNSYYPASNPSGNLWAVNITAPFVTGNYTNNTFYFNYTRNAVVKNSTSSSHGIFWSFNPHNSGFSATSVLSGESIQAYLYVANQTPMVVIVSALLQTTASTNVTTTYIGYNNGYLNFSRTFNVPSVTSNTSMNWTWYLIVNGSRYMEFTTNNVSITTFDLVDCVGGLPTLSYTTYDEQTWAYAIGSNYYAKVDIWSGNLVKSYSKQVLDATNIEWCITPSYASFNANVSLLYGNTSDYVQRSWYWNNMVLNNVSQNISVYVLNTSHAFLTEIDVQNQFGIRQSDIIVLFQKFNYSQGKYFNMTDAITTGTGGTFTYLEEFNTPYKILLYDRIGNLLNTYEDYFIKESPIILRNLATELPNGVFQADDSQLLVGQYHTLPVVQLE